MIGCEEPVGSQNGAITVTSTPSGARIFLDGSDTGRVTPYTVLEVPSGSHTIRLTLDGHTDWGPEAVTVTAGQTASVNATLEPIEPLEPEPPEEYALGLVPVDAQAYRNAPILRAEPVASLPASVDLSADIPRPGNQGQQDSCVGWAVAYALKTYHERIERGWPLNDDRHVMSPAYLYNQIKEPGGGAYFANAFSLLMTQGVSSWALMPYKWQDDDSLPSPAAITEASNYRIAEWGTVLHPSHAEFVPEIKRHLAAGTPVVIGIWVNHDFDSLSESNPVYNYHDGCEWPRERCRAHAITIVGYSDRMAAFKFINSWGTNWGIGGYGWIAYDYSRLLIWEAYVTRDEIDLPDDEPPEAASDPVPRNGTVNVAVDTVLSWTRNARTTSFDVYLGLDRELEAVDLQGSVAQASFSPSLAPGSRYYWRVDARGAGGVTQGLVWSFTTAGTPELPGKTVNPSPANGATGVALDVVLSWDSGGHTTSYDVYFGTGRDLDAGELQGTQTQRTFSPGRLIAGTRYYWRVNANNGHGTTEGDVFSFTTEPGPQPPPPSKPGLSIADASVTEGDGGMADLSFRLSLSAASEQLIRAWARTVAGTAVAGTDYESRAGWVTFSPGRTSETFRVRAYGDTEVEQDEWFRVVVEQVENAVLVDGTATGTIYNDDIYQPPPINRAPTLDRPFPDITLDVGASSGAIDLSDHFSDPDRDTLTYAASSNHPSTATATVSGGRLRVTAESTEGTAVITVTATDPGALSISDTFVVKVNARPQPPVVIRHPSPITFASLDAGTQTLTLSTYITGAIAYEATATPAGILQISITGHVMTITPAAAGEALVTVRGSNQHGNSQPIYVTIVVKEPPPKPGVVWTAVASGLPRVSSVSLNGVAWNGRVFAAVGNTGTIIYSADGRSWHLSRSSTINTLYGVETAPSTYRGTAEMFLATSATGRTLRNSPMRRDAITRSTDGVEWFSESGYNDLYDDGEVAGTRGRFVGVGGTAYLGGTVMYSSLAYEWTIVRVTEITSSRLNGIEWNGDRYVAVGDAGAIIYSTDGISWRSAVSNTVRSLTRVEWNGSVFVAVGDGGTIVYSPDGATWTSTASGTDSDLRDITWNGQRFVVVGWGGTVLVSP